MKVIPFTHSELNQKRYTLKDAVDAALVHLESKYSLITVCVNMIRGRKDNEAITLFELNKVADDLVYDTLYYDDYKVKVRY